MLKIEHFYIIRLHETDSNNDRQNCVYANFATIC